MRRYLDVIRLSRLAAAQDVVEAGKNILRQMDALRGLAYTSHGDRAYSIEQIRMAIVESDLERYRTSDSERMGRKKHKIVATLGTYRDERGGRYISYRSDK